MGETLQTPVAAGRINPVELNRGTPTAGRYGDSNESRGHGPPVCLRTTSAARRGPVARSQLGGQAVPFALVSRPATLLRTIGSSRGRGRAGLKAVSQTGARPGVPPGQWPQPPGTTLPNGPEAPRPARSPRPAALGRSVRRGLAVAEFLTSSSAPPDGIKP